jgi:Fe-S cluster assembly ATP-binding protein
MNLLEIKDLHVEIDGKEILKGINLVLELGKVNALMGPNGSGKSTLANVIMGNQKYIVTKGKIIFNGEDITNLNADERAKKGIFLSFQYPQEITGVTISNFLRAALNKTKEEKISVIDFHKLLDKKLKMLKIKEDFSGRYLNEGFSGGERKKSEILQMSILNPKLAILDETDSGLDIDALRTVAEVINTLMTKDKCILIITHYKRILEYVKPDKVFIINNGKIILDGNSDLVNHLEEKGYGWIEEN